ncbi:MAG: hypothetical protein RH946_05090 [Rhodospirillales bacterium]
MNIKEISTAAAIALTLGFAASAQAGAMKVDHVTADTNPAVFGTTGNVLKSGHFDMKAGHITEATRPSVYGDYDGSDVADKNDVDINLPYQRG